MGRRAKIAAIGFIPTFIGVDSALFLIMSGADPIMLAIIPAMSIGLVSSLAFLFFNISQENLGNLPTKLIVITYFLLIGLGVSFLYKLYDWSFLKPKFKGREEIVPPQYYG